MDWYRGDPARLQGRLERYHFARTLTMLERWDEALAVIAFGVAAHTTDPLYTGLRGVLAARQAAATTRCWKRPGSRGSDSAGADGGGGAAADAVAAALTDLEAAFAHFERAVELGMIRMPLGCDMHSDPLVDPLFGDPRFERVNRDERTPEGECRRSFAGPR